MYINKNYEHSVFIADVPNEPDTLILKDDKTFTSGYFGKGIYSIDDNNITLEYQNEFGKATFRAPIKKNVFEGMKIVLYEDMNHHYRRIE